MPKKVTPKDYINKCKVQGYDLPIENYISAKVKIKHKCSKGHIYEQTPSSHLSGKGCPKCKNIKLSIYKKRTPEEYYNECKEKDLDLPIEKYKGNSIKIKHKCIRNHIYEQRPHDHLQGQGCPKCSRNYSYTPKEYYQECKSKGIDIPIEEYITKVCDGNVKIYEFNDINEANKEWIYSHYPSEEDYDASAVSEEELESTLRKIFGTNLELNVKKDTENTDGYYIPKYNSQIGKYEYSPYGDTIRTDYIIDKITKNDNEYIVRLVEYSVQRDLERNADYDYAVFRYNEISNEFWKNWEKVFEIERGKTGEKEEIDNKILEQKDKFLSYNFVIEKNDIGSFNAIEFKKVSE